MERLSITTRPDNLVPALKKSTISTFEHSLVLSKNGTISRTNWENQHYFETSSALTLKIRTFLTTVLSLSVENGYSICDRSTMSSLMSTLIMTASHDDISVQGSLTAQKEHARFC